MAGLAVAGLLAGGLGGCAGADGGKASGLTDLVDQFGTDPVAECLNTAGAVELSNEAIIGDEGLMVVRPVNVSAAYQPMPGELVTVGQTQALELESVGGQSRRLEPDAGFVSLLNDALSQAQAITIIEPAEVEWTTDIATVEFGPQGVGEGSYVLYGAVSSLNGEAAVTCGEQQVLVAFRAMTNLVGGIVDCSLDLADDAWLAEQAKGWCS